MRKKRKGYGWFFILVLLLSVMGGTAAAQAKEREAPVLTESENQIRLYLGQSMTLTDLPEGEITVDKEGVVAISEKYIMTAVGKGSVKVSVETKTGKKLVAKVEVAANERLDGLTFNISTFAGKVVGTKAERLDIPAFEEMTCQWSCQTPELASVTEDGVITPIRSGTAQFLVKVVDNYGGHYEFIIPLAILEPHFEHEKTNLAKGCQMTLSLQDYSGNPVTYKTMDGSMISLVSGNSSSVVIKARKVGTTTITGSVDGVEFQCRVTVTNPKLKTQYGFYQKKKSFKVNVTGLNADSTPIWSSADVKVGKVNEKGKVSTAQYGSTVIRCKVDGKTLEYYLAVSTKTAVKAMRIGYKKIGKKKYSQARRMSKNYYDCSSFVYRIYRSAGKTLVRKTKWAPVAAEIGKYYVRKKKIVKASGVYDEKKLRPGDLVCFGGSSARRNGRYKRIYHIAMYIGNGRTMESSSAYNNVVIRVRGALKKKEIPVVARP